jgi:hypothetical protein
MNQQQLRKKLHHYNTPGHAHELTFSCYRRQTFLSDPHDSEILSLAARRNQCPHRQGLQSHHSPGPGWEITKVPGTIWEDNQNGSGKHYRRHTRARCLIVMHAFSRLRHAAPGRAFAQNHCSVHMPCCNHKT